MTLDEYFHKIVNQPVKEHLMFNTAQEYMAILKERFTSLWQQPTAFVDSEKYLDDSWSFYARTPGYEEVPSKESFIHGEQDCTWMEIVDQILDVLGHHYGYNIKEQVYYSVHMPLNDPDCAGYGRELNDEVLQKLLLSHPEVYETMGHIE